MANRADAIAPNPKQSWELACSKGTGGRGETALVDQTI
jgi:hypothetical protein